MKLVEALELAEECGLTTIREAVYNVVAHSVSLFEYENIDKEIAELIQEIEKHGLNEEDKIQPILKKLRATNKKKSQTKSKAINYDELEEILSPDDPEDFKE